MNQFFQPVEALEPRLLLNAQVASWLQDSAPDDVTVGPLGSISVPGTVAGDKNVYTFTASATGKVVIDMFAIDGGLDSYLTIYNVKGKKVKKNDNAAKGTLDSKITLNVKAGQVYYIVAEGTKGTEGDYTLRVTSQPKNDAGYTIDTATRLSSTSLSKNAMINFVGDVDVFCFAAKTTGTITLSVVATGKNNPLDLRLTVMDGAGNVIVASESPTTFDVQAGKVYYVQIESANDGIGKYKLTRSKIAPPVQKPGPGGNGSNSPPEQPNFDLPTGKPVAGATITAQVITTATGLQLMICGTLGSDMIVLSQSATTLTLSTGSDTFVFDGEFTSIIVYGFAGNNTFNFTSTVTAQGYIYGGDGNDTYFLAGSGRIWAFGGSGNDHYVAVGGGQAIINGGGGFNSYWVDKTDIVHAPSAAEKQAGAIHVIGEFYQPWTSAADYVGLTPKGENLRDPSITSAANKYTNFSNKPLFAAAGPVYNDVNQGNIGDCYFLACLASLADTNPMIIQQSITPLGDGTYAVRFYDKAGKEVYLRVDGDLPTNSSGQLAYAKTGVDGSIWVPLMEKAYAHFRTGANSYSSINSGWMTDAFQTITGVGTTSRSIAGTAQAVYDFLELHLSAGRAVTTANTGATAGPIIGSHAYMVMGVETVNGEMYVTVYNPWGYDGVSWDSNPSDGLITITIAQFQQFCTGGIVVSKAA
jgi:hypothetical protein